MFDPEPTGAATSNPSGSRKKSDEATTKNPVESRLSPTTPGSWRDAVVALVRSGRDRFHKLVGAQLGRRYRRPPIYWVDDWVEEVFGAFYHHAPRLKFGPVRPASSWPKTTGHSHDLWPIRPLLFAPIHTTRLTLPPSRPTASCRHTDAPTDTLDVVVAVT